MAAGSIFTILFALVAGGLLVFGYMHEEKVIEFEDKLARSIAKAIISARKNKTVPEKAEVVSQQHKTVHVRRRKTVSASSDSGRAA